MGELGPAPADGTGGERRATATRPGTEPAHVSDPEVAPPPARLRRRSGGVSVIAGGLLQDLEEQLRRNLAPIEERVRPGEETRGLGGDPGGPADGSEGGRADPLVIVLPDRE